MKTRSLILHSFLLGLGACSSGALEKDLGVPPGRVDAAAPEDAAAVDADVPDLSGCALPPPGAPAKDSYSFMLNGQLAWSHDEGSPAGYFHTYDALKVGGPEDPPHKVHVLLPRGYGSCDSGYPVIYMNDGDTAFWPGGPGNKSWRVQNALSALYAQGSLRKVIVVAIVPVDRDFEYSHVQVAPDRKCCGADRYVSYVADSVRGFINRSYRTQRDAASTAIIGSSRGGLAAFYLATRRPEVFGRAGCMSSSFWAGLDPVLGGMYSGGPLSTAPLIVPVTRTLQDRLLRPRLWIDWGLVRTGGTHNSNIEAAATTRGREMAQLLKTTYSYVEGSDLFVQEDPTGEHDEDSWGRRIPFVLKALIGR